MNKKQFIPFIIKQFLPFIIVVIAYGLFTRYRMQHKDGLSEDMLPPTPNYCDTTQWYVTDRSSEADVFYIISTETGDYALDGKEYHFAHTYNDSVRQPLYSEMLGVDTLLSGRLNFYSPYYRQCSLQTFTSDSTAEARMPIPLDDVRSAFKYYMTNLNQGRPFILAGFSQGAIILLQLLKEMDDSTYARMVAAYAIGTTIPQKMMDECPKIKPAMGAEDTGVTICYNSVRDAQCSDKRHERSVIAINPVNWRTDSVAAVFATEPTPLLPVAEQKKDKLSVSLDPTTNLLFVSGYTAEDYVLPLIGQEGNYHSREIWLYRQQLRENMARRTAAYSKKIKYPRR